MSPVSTSESSSILSAGTRKTAAPARSAPITLSSIPPIGPTRPRVSIVPVPAMVSPAVMSPGVSRS